MNMAALSYKCLRISIAETRKGKFENLLKKLLELQDKQLVQVVLGLQLICSLQHRHLPINVLSKLMQIIQIQIQIEYVSGANKQHI